MSPFSPAIQRPTCSVSPFTVLFCFLRLIAGILAGLREVLTWLIHCGRPESLVDLHTRHLLLSAFSMLVVGTPLLGHVPNTFTAKSPYLLGKYEEEVSAPSMLTLLQES